jgi:enoyl-CoA hydratase/carnithine racemase
VEYETILFETSNDHVATITINRPDSMNTFNKQMCDEFEHLWNRIREDDEIHAVVVRASTESRAFCTGVDVKQGYHYNLNPTPWLQRDPGEFLGPKQNNVWKPVICAVHGLAGGGAFYWINEADIVICSDDAQFFDPHVTFGLTAACEPIGMSRRIPLAETLRIALMGNDERVCAETALRISLVTEIVSRDDLWTRAHEIAAIIAAKPSAATQGTVRSIWDSLEMGMRDALKWGFHYAQLGNSASRMDRSKPMVKAKWRLR